MISVNGGTSAPRGFSATMKSYKPRRGIRLVKRMYPPRIIGVGLGLAMVAGGLHQIGVPSWVWVLMAINGLLWPHVAYFSAMRSASPYDAEHRNILIDSVCGGFWAVAMGFNLLPCVLMLAMLTMDNVAIGGMRLLSRGIIAQLVGAVVAWPLLGGRLELASNLYVILASIPFMVAYPLIIGVISNRLSRQLSEQKREMEVLSRRDALSGLATRGYWEVRLGEEFRRWQRHRRPATLLLADIDHFKRINDSHGHLFGDQVIRVIGDLLNGVAREEDIVGRYGGEEFGVILPETSEVNAFKVAQRIQQALAAVTLPRGLDLQLTVSVGVATLTPNVSKPREWLSRADQALYRAKQEGRNRICVFEEDDVATASG